jgi:S1/P1 Nuclease
VSASRSAVAWGPEGHEIVATLAEEHLNQNAKAGVRSLIRDASLASVSNWADEIRHDRDETYNWHFVDIPSDASGFSDERDCFLGNNKHKDAATGHHNCVVDRIEIFERVLADVGAPREQRIEALKFVVHFVGDIHQPFHAIGEAVGGNGISVVEFGSPECGQCRCNVHGAWDSGLIQHTGMNTEQYVAHIEKMISEGHVNVGGTPEEWANESHQFARSALLQDGGQVDEPYYRNEIKVVDERLAQAGVRLANLLNHAFSSAPGKQLVTQFSSRSLCSRDPKPMPRAFGGRLLVRKACRWLRHLLNHQRGDGTVYRLPADQCRGFDGKGSGAAELWNHERE